MRLTREEFTLLYDALVDAFPDYASLSLMVARSGGNLAAVAPPGPLGTVALAVIRDAEARDRVDLLVESSFSTGGRVWVHEPNQGVSRRQLARLDLIPV